jgi:hypothetical protein
MVQFMRGTHTRHTPHHFSRVANILVVAISDSEPQFVGESCRDQDKMFSYRLRRVERRRVVCWCHQTKTCVETLALPDTSWKVIEMTGASL